MCEQRCAAGDAAACARAAELYFEGKNGHALDMARSFRHAARACRAGDAHGCMLAGYHHQDGLGTAWDPGKAVAAYERACAGGSGTACYNLATMYSGGHGVDSDMARANDYTARARAAWEAACKGGEPRWCTNAAFAMDGDGEPSTATRQAMLALDQRACDAQVLIGCVEAARLKVELGELTPTAWIAELERLCSAGEPEACTAAAFTLLEGERLPKEPGRAIGLLGRACRAGEKHACLRLGIETQLGQVVAKDEAAALRFLAVACDRAAGRACFLMAAKHTARGDKAETVRSSRRACWMGQAESCGVLGQAYLGGHVVAQSEPAHASGLARPSIVGRRSALGRAHAAAMASRGQRGTRVGASESGLAARSCASCGRDGAWRPCLHGSARLAAGARQSIRRAPASGPACAECAATWPRGHDSADVARAARRVSVRPARAGPRRALI